MEMKERSDGIVRVNSLRIQNSDGDDLEISKRNGRPFLLNADDLRKLRKNFIGKLVIDHQGGRTVVDLSS